MMERGPPTDGEASAAMELVTTAPTEEEQTYGGWPTERLLIDLPEVFRRQLECPVCMMMVKDAVQCHNQHGICESCWVLSEHVCPLCKSKKAPVPAQLLRQMVDKMTIRCSGEGCTAATLIESIDSHERECPLVRVTCPNQGCEDQMLRRDLRHHIANVCGDQLVQCGQCGVQIARRDAGTHSCLQHILQITAALQARNQALEQRNDALERRMMQGEHEKNTLLSMIAMLRVDPAIPGITGHSAVGSSAADASGGSGAGQGFTPVGGTFSVVSPEAARQSAESSRKRKKTASHVAIDPAAEVCSMVASTVSATVGNAGLASAAAATPTEAERPSAASGAAAPVVQQQRQWQHHLYGQHQTSVSGASADIPSDLLARIASRQVATFNPNSFLFVIGGYDGLTAHSSIERYDGRSWAAHTARGTITKRSDFACTTVNGVAFVAGGRSGRANLNSAEAFDGSEWRPLPKMSCKRAYFGFASLGGAVYAGGGNNGRHDLDSVERYSPGDRAWTTVQRMSTKRSAFSFAELGGALYAVGGTEADITHATTERYTPSEGWTPAPSMDIARSGAAVTVFRNEIYAIGGIAADGSFLSHVEKFDGERWHPVAPLITNRSTAAATVFQDSIYVIGGYNNAAGLLESVERFDGYTWSLVRPMSIRRNAAVTFEMTLPQASATHLAVI